MRVRDDLGLARGQALHASVVTGEGAWCSTIVTRRRALAVRSVARLASPARHPL